MTTFPVLGPVSTTTIDAAPAFRMVVTFVGSGFGTEGSPTPLMVTGPGTTTHIEQLPKLNVPTRRTEPPAVRRARFTAACTLPGSVAGFADPTTTSGGGAPWAPAASEAPAARTATRIAWRTTRTVVSTRGAWSESGRPGSNRRPSAWEADALPTELHPRVAARVAHGYMRSGASTPMRPSPVAMTDRVARSRSRRNATTSGASPTTRHRW